MLGVVSQSVRATATAQATSGNASECPTPWAVADKWLEVDNAAPSIDPTKWDQYDLFKIGTDVYRAPLVGEPGPPTGFTLKDDKGYQVVLKDDDTGDYSSGWSRIIEFGPNGGNVLPELISGCPAWVSTVGLWAGQSCEDRDDTDYARGCINVKTGTVQGTNRHGVEISSHRTAPRCGIRAPSKSTARRASALALDRWCCSIRRTTCKTSSTDVVATTAW